MIRRLHVRNFKALRDVALDLTPIHVLIGPNDSGKSSILQALAALARSASMPLTDAFGPDWHGRELVWGAAGRGTEVHFEADLVGDDAALTYEASVSFTGGEGKRIALAGLERAANSSGGMLFTRQASTSGFTAVGERRSGGRPAGDAGAPALDAVADLLDGVEHHHWHPRYLRLPSAPSPKRRLRLDPSGFGLAGCLDDLLGEHRQEFVEMEKAFCELFPGARTIRLRSARGYETGADGVTIAQNVVGKEVVVAFEGGYDVRGPQLSDGAFIALAYLSLVHRPAAPRLLLIEEPENGLHPNRLKAVIGMLRRIAQAHPRTQIVLTTHSPYVLDEFAAEEVTLCTRGKEEGAIATRRLSDNDEVRRLLKHFTLGEIWTSEGDEVLAGGAGERHRDP